ncbi:MAG TPA: GAF and ANTAR domain-containing protein [Nocardioides sp.]|nr:GAF and ANTAR domain-containing protein [Nocardioides sp.]
MEPIPETAEVLAELAASGESGLRQELELRARLVRAFVPDCVGMSLASKHHGVTFTLVASSDQIAVLDAVQYLHGGPCVDAAHTDEVRVLDTDDEALLDEAGWQQFARASAAHAIASTLSLPIIDRGKVVGSVNLYAASARAFDGLHDELATIFGAWAPGAVTNADLTFSTRGTAQDAPRTLRENATVDRAVTMLAEAADLTAEEARASLREAARRAGVTEADLAETLFQIHSDPDTES